jgi:CheY-like chemotaxis protein
LRDGRLVIAFAQSAQGALQYITDAMDTSLILILSDINMPGTSGASISYQRQRRGRAFPSS